MKNKVLPVIAAATLAMTSFTALADGETILSEQGNSKLKVVDTVLTKVGDTVEGNGGGTATLSGTADAPVLTLTNFEYSGIGSAEKNEGVFHDGIYYGPGMPDLTIVLVGENRIELDAPGGDDPRSVGINIISDTTIRAESGGSLYVSSGDCEGGYVSAGLMFRAGSLTLESGEITAVGGKASNSGGIWGFGGNVIINTAVTAISESGSAIASPFGEASVINSAPGKGWIDAAGTKGETAIETSTSAQSISAGFKRVEFVPAAAPAAAVTGAVTQVVANNEGNDNGATAFITKLTQSGDGEVTVSSVRWDVMSGDSSQSFTKTDELPTMTFGGNGAAVTIALALDGLYDPAASADVTVE